MVALNTSGAVSLPGGTLIRVVGAGAFTALKFAAYHDRGRTDPSNSHDLEDVFVLIACRPSIAVEVALTPVRVRDFVASNVQALLADPYLDELLASHLNNAFDAAATAQTVRARLQRIAVIRG